MVPHVSGVSLGVFSRASFATQPRSRLRTHQGPGPGAGPGVGFARGITRSSILLDPDFCGLEADEELEAGKWHALIGMVKAHPASVKVIVLLFSDRENLLLLTLDDHRLHGKQAQPLCFAPC